MSLVGDMVHKTTLNRKDKNLLIWLSKRTLVSDYLSHSLQGERGGSVVECWTPEREVRGSRPTAAVLCP